MARAIAPGRGQFTDDLVRLIRTQIADLDRDGELSSLLQGSVEENVSRLIQILEGTADPTADEPPHGAMEYARHLGQSDTSLTALLRAYRIGQARITEHTLFAGAGLEPPLGTGAQLAVVGMINAYVDHVSEHVTVAYQREHERWLTGREGLRHAVINRILAGDEVDLTEAERVLGYGLNSPHLAVIVFTEDADGTLGRALDSLTGPARSALISRHGQREAFLWLPMNTLARATKALEAMPPRVAYGAPGEGIDGFRRSHRQAQAVQRLMRSSRHQPPSASWTDVAFVAEVAESRDHRDEAGATLGDLAGDDPRAIELRDTLRVWLECNRSAAAAASAMHLHRNTVNYRVAQALELCATDPGEHLFKVLTALTLDRWRPLT